jgi:hypothetical protein
MSGPIIRKYGFPNFEEIFGKREMKHGVEPAEAPRAEEPKASATKAGPSEPDSGTKKSD